MGAKNNMRLIFAFYLLIVPNLGHSETDSAPTEDAPVKAQSEASALGTQLDSLELPPNSAGTSVVREKLYSVQDRYMPLDNRFEVSFSGAHQITDTGFIATREAALGARYYINSKWSVGGAYSYAFNELTESTNNFYEEEGILPKVSFVKSRAELTARYLLFYGKFRLSMDTVLYFDHFVSAGPAMIMLNTGNSIGAVAETGFVFWFGKNWNALFGVKNYAFSKLTNSGEKQFSNQVQIYFSGGFLFGGI